ncbi:MAG TPA: DinB family protein [Candidatus Dormibacteraeota bacterium]
MASEHRTGETVPERWTQSTEHPDMWTHPNDDPRDTGVEVVGERATLLEYLRAYRLTLRLKCVDLDADQLALRSVLPSTMSLLGLVRHMADVERSWFRRVMAGEVAPRRFSSDDDREGAWSGAVGDPAVVAQAWAALDEEVAFAERFVSDTDDLSTMGHMSDGGTISLREVLVHMIEEYARHCGHADLLRERIDGRVGQ